MSISTSSGRLQSHDSMVAGQRSCNLNPLDTIPHLWLLIDPVELAVFVFKDLLGTEPQGDLLLRTLHTI